MNTLLLRRPTAAREPRGFTLVELLVVIAMIGILMSLLIPAVTSMREVARRSTCLDHLTRIGMALQNYESAYGALPPGTIDRQGPIHNVARGHHMGWLVELLPYLDEASTQKHVDFAASVYDPKNAAVRAVSIRLLLCPTSAISARSDAGDGTARVGITSYVGCHHDVEAPIDTTNHGVLYLNSHTSQRDVTDGPSHTIFVGEKRPEADDLGWMSGTRATLRNAGHRLTTADAVSPPGTPASPDLYVGGFGSMHPVGCNFLFGDGAVHLLTTATDLEVLQQLANRADGKLLTGGPTRGE